MASSENYLVTLNWKTFL